MDNSNDYGKLLRKLRRAADMTQTVLGKHIGVSAAYISAVEKGRRNSLSLKRTRRIVKVLGDSPELIALSGRKYMTCGCQCSC